MNWLKWLLGFKEPPSPVLESAEKKSCKCSPEKISVKKFVDPETGKVYKTERSLKSAQSRRKNKGNKKTKKAKKAKK